MTGNRSAITSPGKMIWTLLAGTALAPLCFLLMNTIVLSPGQTPSFFQTMVIVAVTVALRDFHCRPDICPDVGHQASDSACPDRATASGLRQPDRWLPGSSQP
ncbi:MAG: hypothetical protein R2758_15160 [Bacteroidales bacterium]